MEVVKDIKEIRNCQGKTISVIPISDKVRIKRLSGFKYCVEDLDMRRGPQSHAEGDKAKNCQSDSAVPDHGVAADLAGYYRGNDEKGKQPMKRRVGKSYSLMRCVRGGHEGSLGNGHVGTIHCRAMSELYDRLGCDLFRCSETTALIGLGRVTPVARVSRRVELLPAVVC